MTKHLLPALLLIAVLAAGCHFLPDESAPQADLFEVHLWQVFDEDTVQIEIDDRPIFNGVVTTDPRLSLAEIISADVTVGPHRLDVTINEKVHADTMLVLRDTVIVGISYHEGAIDFRVLKERPGYH